MLCLGETETLTLFNIGSLFSLVISLSVNASSFEEFLIWSNLFSNQEVKYSGFG